MVLFVEQATATRIVQGRPATQDGVMLSSEKRFGGGEDVVGEKVVPGAVVGEVQVGIASMAKLRFTCLRSEVKEAICSCQKGEVCRQASCAPTCGRGRKLQTTLPKAVTLIRARMATSLVCREAHVIVQRRSEPAFTCHNISRLASITSEASGFTPHTLENSSSLTNTAALISTRGFMAIKYLVDTVYSHAQVTSTLPRAIDASLSKAVSVVSKSSTAHPVHRSTTLRSTLRIWPTSSSYR